MPQYVFLCLNCSREWRRMSPLRQQAGYASGRNVLRCHVQEELALPISANHPLRRLFIEMVAKELPADREVVAYVSGLLIDFVHVDHLYRIRNARGKRLEDVGEMLVESNPLLGASSFER